MFVIICIKHKDVLEKKIRITKVPRVTDEGWTSQRQLSVPVKKEKNIGTYIYVYTHYVKLHPHKATKLYICRF